MRKSQYLKKNSKSKISLMLSAGLNFDLNLSEEGKDKDHKRSPSSFYR
jgi:hypothetical protein